jgi:DNA ligase (NAD+)
VHIDQFSTHQEELNFLSNSGFPINPYNSVQNSLQDVWKFSKELETKREKLTYPIDGLVVKLDNNILAEKVGVVGKTPRAWCAIKFAPEEVSTTIEDIIWQVGRTGKITPVAVLQPIMLMGTEVKRASLHNYKEVSESELHFSDTVIIRKAGDIIPEVINILKNLRHSESKIISAPITCPSCGIKLKLTKTRVDLYCPNSTNCKDQIVGRLSYFCQRNLGNIVGLSEKNILKFIEEFGIKDIPDLYNLPWDKISELEGFGQKSIQNLQESIKESLSLQDYKFLAGIGIDGIGIEVSKLIIEQLYDKQN